MSTFGRLKPSKERTVADEFIIDFPEIILDLALGQARLRFR
jgi:hypothetical protein